MPVVVAAVALVEPVVLVAVIDVVGIIAVSAQWIVPFDWSEADLG